MIQEQILFPQCPFIISVYIPAMEKVVLVIGIENEGVAFTPFMDSGINPDGPVNIQSTVGCGQFVPMQLKDVKNRIGKSATDDGTLNVSPHFTGKRGPLLIAYIISKGPQTQVSQEVTLNDVHIFLLLHSSNTLTHI